MMSKSIGVAGALALFALLITGCGGSGSKELSKAEFVKQGNAICEEATKAREKALVEFSETTNPKANQEVVREKLLAKILPLYEGAAEQLGELGAPAGDKAKVEGIVEAMEEAAARVEADPQTAAVGSLPFKKANEAAESYGLKACAI
ncbi:MAG TPA: hypothetical protein VFK14_02510 [Solirubrobacterales bacterium]|nr:hypothetical protein [Solirubrobacterales bacterium]